MGPGPRSPEAPVSTRSCLHNCQSRKGQGRTHSPAHVTTAGTIPTAIPPETLTCPGRWGRDSDMGTGPSVLRWRESPGLEGSVGSAPNALSPAHLLGQKEVTWRMRQVALGWQVASIKEQALSCLCPEKLATVSAVPGPPCPQGGHVLVPLALPLSSISRGIAWTSICRPIAMDKVTLGVYVPHDQQTLFAAYPLVNIFFPKTIVFFVELKTFTLLSTYLSL